MTVLPEPTLYHRWVGWHAPALRQGLVSIGIGVVGGLLVALVQPWQVAVVAGWDVTALCILAVTWPMILRADGEATKNLAKREDPGRIAARGILLTAAVASLVGVGTLLALAGKTGGYRQLIIISIAVLTIVLSWTVVNTIYVLRYAQIHYTQGYAGMGFADRSSQEKPSFRDFAYVAFTIGMTYQVSDTSVRDPHTRRVVLGQALLAYLFGVVIIAGSINLVAGLVR